MVTYIFDGSLEGLLTAVFEFYERKPGAVQLIQERLYQPVMLEDVFTVMSDEAKAKRVWAGLCKKLNAQWQQTFCRVYLAESAAAFQHLFDFACYIFDNPQGAESNFGNLYVIALSQIERKVSRERHRMKAFIRFQKTADGMYYAPIEPDFNVLPLIATFLKTVMPTSNG